MFGLGGGEIFLVAVLAVLLIGPKDLPRVASRVGRFYRRFRNATQEFKTTVEREIDLSEQKPAPKNSSDHG